MQNTESIVYVRQTGDCEAEVYRPNTGYRYIVEYYDRLSPNDDQVLYLSFDSNGNWDTLHNPLNGATSRVYSVHKINY